MKFELLSRPETTTAAPKFTLLSRPGDEVIEPAVAPVAHAIPTYKTDAEIEAEGGAKVAQGVPANGLIEAGNQDASKAGPFWTTISFSEDGKNLTAVIPGRFTDTQSALQSYKRTGKHFGKFDSGEKAAAFMAAAAQPKSMLERVGEGLPAGDEMASPFSGIKNERPNPLAPRDTTGTALLKAGRVAVGGIAQAGLGAAQALADAPPQYNVELASQGAEGARLADAQYLRDTKAYADNTQRPQATPIGKLAAIVAADMKANTPNVEPFSPLGVASSVVESAPMMIAAAAATLATKNPMVGASVMGVGTGAQEYGQERVDGIAPGKAALGAVVNGFAEALGENIPLGMMMKSGGGFLTQTLKTAGAEGVQELFTQIIQTGYDKGMLHPDMTWGEAWSQVVQAGLVGAAMGSGLHPLAHAAGGLRREDAPDEPRTEPTMGPAIIPEDIRPGDVESPIPTELIAKGRAKVRTALQGKSAPPQAPVETPAIQPVMGATAGPVLPQSAPPAPTKTPVALTPVAAPAPTKFTPIVEEQPKPAPVPARAPITTRDIKEDTAITAAGGNIPVRYAVVEAKDLVASQTQDGRANPAYPAELQPRDRSRAVSEAQIANIAQTLNPRLLDQTPKASDGAPIVSPDGTVESGNGRTLAIQRAYERGLPTAETYRAHLAAQGYPVDGMTAPVLVRVRTNDLSPEDRQAFTREANQTGTMSMSAPERAVSDAKSLTPSMLDLYRGGDIEMAQNRPFVRAFMEAAVDKGDHATMIGADGALSQDGIRRVQGALLGKAYDDPNLIADLTENADTNIKAIGGALTDIAPLWSKMREEAGDGTIHANMDVTKHLLDAVRLVQRARNEGRNVAEFVGQGEMFGGAGVDPMTEGVLRLMFRNVKDWTQPIGRDKLADALRFYAEQARQASAGPSLFGEASTAKPGDILALAKEKQGGQAPAAGPDLFKQPANGSAREDLRAHGGQGAQPNLQSEPAGSGVETPRAGSEGVAPGAAPKKGRASPSIEQKLATKKPLKTSELQALYAQYFKPGRVVQGYGSMDVVTTAPKWEKDGSWTVGVKEIGKDGKPTQRERFHSTAPGNKALLAFVRSKEYDAAPAIGDGTRAAPVQVSHPDHIEAARQQVDTNPTDGQKEAGNYAKGHLNFQGLDVTLENPKGSQRSGTGSNGKPWSVTMPADYGYVKRTEGADGDQFDVYLGDKPNAKKVYVIDQTHADTKKFDEHKAMMGFGSREEALATYEKGFSDGRGKDRIGGVRTMSLPEFETYIETGDLSKPASPFTKAGAEPKKAEAPANKNIPPLRPHEGSWMIVDRETGKAVREIHRDSPAINNVNFEKYKAVPANEYLAGLNAPAAPKAEEKPATAPKADYGDKNKVFTKDAAEAARALIRKKLGGDQLNSGIDPELMQAGITLAGYHIEAGARSFVDFGNAMMADLGEAVRPYLKSWYNAVRDYPGINVSGLTPYDEITPQLVASLSEKANGNAGNSSADVERGGEERPAGDGVVPTPVPDEPGQADEGDRSEVPGNGEGRSGQDRGARGSDRGSVHVGELFAQPLQEGAPGSGRPVPGRPQSERSGDPGNEGLPADRTPAATVAKSARDAAPTVKQQSTGGTPEIRASAPMLFTEQHDDVAFAEARFEKPDGDGVMFTNGTGTGKTFVGGGIAKRFIDAGKTNIMFVAPSQNILDAWVDAAAKIGFDVSILEDTARAGRGPVATTYANLRQNLSLADREWDLVVPDESQHLMSSGSADVTGALSAFRAITNHPDGARLKAEMQLRAKLAPIDKELSAFGATLKQMKRDRFGDARDDKMSALYAQRDKMVRDKMQANAELPRSKVVFLSATPFPYDQNIDYAEGYLFDYPPETHGGYNTPSGRSAFFIEHFGYRMRTGKLTKPDAAVVSDLMERQFHEWMRRQGVLSGRVLTVDKDYDRKFILVNDGIGTQIDQALEFLSTAEKGRFSPLADIVRRRFDYLRRMQLLEAMKAKAAVPYIKKQHALGRKVVVFHDYNVGGGFNPFDFSGQNGEINYSVDGKSVTAKVQDLVAAFHAANPYVAKMDFTRLTSPLATMQREFPGVLLYNGTVPNKVRSLAKKRFNDDNDAAANLIVVQSAAGEAGISLHDTTGKYQRVILNLGMPVKPTTAIQEEGRIYRVGQATNAIFRYMNTGTNWERWTFAGKIAERSGTAENLALGNLARMLKRSFIDAFADTANYEPSLEEGTGGKELDRAAATMSPFEAAKTFYYAQGKKSGRRDQREGTDYFATPEPVGLKMVEFANVHPGEKILEPSAGHGAIARFFPEEADRTLVEPSFGLASKAELSSPGARIVQQRFEDLHISNKFDAIVMNPPFGVGGKTAMEHVEKAVGHLREGGRVVALIPSGGMATKRFESFMESEAAEGIYLVADIELPAVTFERAGTAVRTHIVVLEKRADPTEAPQQVSRDYSSAEDINQLFDRIENASIPDRKPVKAPEVEAPAEPVFNNGRSSVIGAPSPAPVASTPGSFKLAETTHAKKGIKLFVATLDTRVERDAYNRLNSLAKQNGGYYSAFRGNGAIPGFQFESAADRAAFLADAEFVMAAKQPPAGKFARRPGAVAQEGFDVEPGALDGQGNPLPQVIFPGMSKATPDEVAAYQSGTEAEKSALVDELRQRSVETGARMKAEAQARELKRRQDAAFAQPKPTKKQPQTADMFAPPKPQGSLFARASQTDTPQFKRWFADSKVLDDDGNPRVVYHGAELGADFDAFNEDAFFSSDEDTAATYGEVIPVYLSMKNPLIVNAKGRTYKSFVPFHYIAPAKAGGHDGVIVKNIRDDARMSGAVANTYIVFRPEQIKSADGNSGAFDPGDDRMAFARSTGDGAADDGTRTERLEDMTLTYSPEFEPHRAALAAEMRRAADAMGLEEFGIRIADAILPHGGGRAGGHFDMEAIITLALDDRNAWATDEPRAYLTHEAIHVFHKFGMFTRGEWRILVAESRRKYVKEYADLLKEYPDDSIHVEEAIAFAAMEDPAAAPGSIVGRLRKKVRDFLNALRNFLVGRGFKTPESIFADIKAGGFKGRVNYGDGATSSEFRGGNFAAAYHGTPHDFDEFRTDKIGTGEGAQSYGHGLYFAGNKEVAEYYRSALGNRAVTADVTKGVIARHLGADNAARLGLETASVRSMIYRAMYEKDAPLDAAKKIQWANINARSIPKQAIADAISELREKAKGRLFHVDLAPKDDEWLDWDKPLSEQSEKVKAALRSMPAAPPGGGWSNDTVGEQIYRGLSKHLAPPEKSDWTTAYTGFEGAPRASAALQAAGIPGIRYLDQGSRGGAGKGTYNYVVFDAKDVKVLSKFARRPTTTTTGSKGPTLPPAEQAPEELPLPKYAGSINLERIEGPDDLKAFILDVTKQNGEFAATRRGKMTIAQIAAGAPSPEKGLEILLGRKVGHNLTAEETLTARVVMATVSENAREKMRKAVGGTDADKVEAIRAMALNTATLAQMSGAATEAGRTLRMYREMASELRNAEGLKRIIEEFGGSDKIEDIAEMVAAINDLEAASRFVDKAYRVTTWDMIMEAWINGLLSGPQTHIVNATSNILTALTAIPETAIAAGLGVLHSGARVMPGEVLDRLYGTVQGALDGARAGARAFATEATTDGGKIEQSRHQAIPSVTFRAGKEKARFGGVPIPFTGEVKLGGKQVRVPGRMLQASDEFFKAIARRQEYSVQARRVAASQGLKGAAMDARIAELVADPTPRMRKAADLYARHQTFQDRLGPFGRGVVALTNQKTKMGRVAKIIVPFARTMINIQNYAAERTPFAYLYEGYGADLRGVNGKVRQDEARARVIFGTSVAIAAAYFAAQGLLTGGGPDDPEERALWLINHKPYSIKSPLTGEWLPYGRIEPAATIFGIVADAVDIGDRFGDDVSASWEWLSKIGSAVVASIGHNILDKNYMRGLSDVMDALNNPTRYAQQWAENLVGSVIPSVVAQQARAQDPYLREADGLVDTLKSRTPGLSQTLKPRRDVFGEMIKRPSTGSALDVLNPFIPSKDPRDPVADELTRLDVTIPRIPKKVGRATLTPEEHDELAQAQGRLIRRALVGVINLAGYKRQNDVVQRIIVEEVIHAVINPPANGMSPRQMIERRHPDLIRREVDEKLKPFKGIAAPGR